MESKEIKLIEKSSKMQIELAFMAKSQVKNVAGNKKDLLYFFEIESTFFLWIICLIPELLFLRSILSSSRRRMQPRVLAKCYDWEKTSKKIFMWSFIFKFVIIFRYLGQKKLIE